jgi:hypothetical protein
MLSPTTLTFSVFALVFGDRPLRTGLWFYLGALGATLAIGVLAAFVLGNHAASQTSTPKTWVAIVDILAGLLAVGYVVWTRGRPVGPEKMAGMMERMRKVASSPAIAVIGAGATLANPGAFIAIAVKDISQLDVSTARFIIEFALFALISLLPLGVALLMLAFVPDRAERVLEASRGWLERHAMTVASVILVLLGVALLRNGISGLN